MSLSLLPQLHNFAIECTAGGDFLGFPTWYKYACGHDFRFLADSSGPSDIPLIILAVVEILLRIAALAAVAYVVFGGVKYVVSQGQPDKISEAKGTIINALAGLLIATFAVAFVSFLGNRLG
jgi:hypothetical protein